MSNQEEELHEDADEATEQEEPSATEEAPKANDDDEPGYDPESFSQENYNKLVRASRNASAEAKRYREAKEALAAQLADATSDADANASRLLGAIKRAEAKTELIKAGIREAAVSRFVKMLDLEAVSVDADQGTITGLVEQIEAIKEDFPEVFAPPADAKAPAKSKAGVANKAQAPKDITKRTTGQTIANIINGVKQ